MHMHTAKQYALAAIQRLPENVEIVPELNEKTMREVSLYSYRIIYHIPEGQGTWRGTQKLKYVWLGTMLDCSV